MLTAIFLALIGTSIFIIVKVTHKSPEPQEAEIVADNSTENITIIDTVVEDVEIEEENEYLLKSDDSDKFFEGYVIEQDENTAYIASEEVQSSYGLLINLDTGKVVASKDGNVRINPASMTKILTLLVAVEHLDDIDNHFTMTQEIGDYVFKNGCSQVGFEVGEEVPVQDLLYGTILPSGASTLVRI